MPPEDIADAHELARALGVSEADTPWFVQYYLTDLTVCRNLAETILPSTPREAASRISTEFVNVYRQKRARGHGEDWAKAYAQEVVDWGEANGYTAEKAYRVLRANDARKTPDGAVYREAFAAYTQQGHPEEHAAAFAKHIAEEDAIQIDQYVAAYAAVRHQGHSLRYATDYALMICSGESLGAAARFAASNE